MVDDSSPNFSATGSWSAVAGWGGDFHETGYGYNNVHYAFQFTGLTPNQTYSRTAVASWPSHAGLTTSGSLSVSGSTYPGA